jgi:D-glycero-D-manno-heptose 1,7-bisphosphate phosphatase
MTVGNAGREMASSGRKALILDRDGVVHLERGYLWRAEEVEFLPGIWELCRKARDHGYVIVIVTNQSGIARGYYSEADLKKLMEWMAGRFQGEGVELAGWYYCPHHPQGHGEYRKECSDRKPGPGMILQAARDLNLDLSHSVMVGDRCSDVGAANAARVGRMFLIAGTEAGKCDGEYEAIDGLSAVTLALRE